jgi:hypothetical protein
MPIANQLCDRSILTQPGADTNNQLLSDRSGETLERVERWLRSPTLHPSDRRLRVAHPLGELSLRQTCLGAEREHQLPNVCDPGLVIDSGTRHIIVGPSHR